MIDNLIKLMVPTCRMWCATLNEGGITDDETSSSTSLIRSQTDVGVSGKFSLIFTVALVTGFR